ncbi:MAG: hypothetical protein ACR2NY_04090 [Alphaproteobacteria bacterium]
MNKIGDLTIMDIRDLWPNEPDFTKWLSNNLSKIAEKIGVDELIRVDIEYLVGDFKADIVAKDDNSNFVVIENQFEETDHKHLGQVITYASGIKDEEHETKTIIWIVKEARAEHINAIQWLNENISNNIKFFLIKLTVVKIEDSPCAPLFDIIIAPNDFQKTTRDKIKTSEELSEANKNTMEFFKQYIAYIKSDETKDIVSKKYSKGWFDVYSSSEYKWLIRLSISTQKGIVACRFLTKDFDFFEFLKSKEKDIKKDFDIQEIEWRETGRKERGFAFSKSSNQLNDENNFSTKDFDWLYDISKKIKDIMPKYIKEYENNYKEENDE